MFWKRSKKIGGYIGFYGLQEWWLSFSEDERAYILERFKPFGGEDTVTLTTGTFLSTTQSKAQFLYTLAGWFKTKKDSDIGIKILEESKFYLTEVLERHFWYSSYIEIRYKQRNDDSEALGDVIAACEAMIALAPDAAKKFHEGYDEFGKDRAVPPGHNGYRQLITIRKKQGDKAEATRLADEFTTVWR